MSSLPVIKKQIKLSTTYVIARPVFPLLKNTLQGRTINTPGGRVRDKMHRYLQASLKSDKSTTHLIHISAIFLNTSSDGLTPRRSITKGILRFKPFTVTPFKKLGFPSTTLLFPWADAPSLLATCSCRPKRCKAATDGALVVVFSSVP